MNTFSKLTLVLLSVSYQITAHAQIDVSSLVKVTKDNNPACIEYYTYMSDLYCSTTAQTPSSKINPLIRTYETQKIIFDDRVWQAAWGKKTDEINAVEYVPAGDDIDKWNELITSQFFPGLQDKVTVSEFFNNFKKSMQESGFKPVYNIIEETPDRILFEFRLDKPTNMQQDELQVITKGKDGIYVLHYVIKKSDMGEQNRAKWINLLKQSKPI